MIPESKSNVRHPKVTVELTGQSANAYYVLGAAANAMRRAGLPESEIDTYLEEAKSGDYDHLLLTTMRWVNVE